MNLKFFPSLSSQTLLAALFLSLAFSLAMLMLIYWVFILDPRLQTEAQANAKILAESQARIIASNLSSSTSAITQNDIDQLHDQILVFVDPELARPYFTGITFELDAEVLPIADNTLSFNAGNMDCKACFKVTTALYSPLSDELLGVVNFSVSAVFYQKLKNDVKQILLLESFISLIVLLLVWIAVHFLIRKLDYEIIKRQQMATQLSQAKDQAELANQAKTEFMANMSHEIRTPLNAINGMTYLLNKTILDQHQSNLLNQLNSSSQLLLKLINDLLDFSKIEAGKLQLESIPFKLNEVLSHAAELCHSRAEEKNLQLIFYQQPEIALYLQGDPLRLQQIILNLINNAIKFTQSGFIFCIVETADNNRLLRFAICDSGIGIKADKLVTLFQPFTQADNSTTRKFGGTGLGLSICKQLITQMQGNIKLQSHYGVGSCVEFTLPLIISDEPPLNPRLKPNCAEEIQQRMDFSGKKILLAEDNFTNQQVTIALLDELKLQLDIADNGLQAVAASKTKQYDLILMDVQMPEMDGYQATQKIRTDKNYADTPIIALSAHSMQGEKQQCLDVGMNDYLAKPIDIKLFYQLITDYLGQKVDIEQIVLAKPNNSCAISVKNINYENALLRLRGNQQLLSQLLSNFASQNSHITDHITQAIRKGEYTLARQLVHGLKGEAATLEATTLVNVVKTLEQALINQSDDIPLLTEELKLQLDSVLKDIGIIENKIASKQVDKGSTENIDEHIDEQMDSENLQQQLNELKKLLADNNLDAKKFAISVTAILDNSVYSKPWEKVNTAIKNLDFDSARKFLEEINIDSKRQ